MKLLESFSTAHTKMLEAYYNTQSGHIGGGLSILPALVSLFHNNFNAEFDKLVFSKGHNALALYTTLNIYGFISDEEFETFYKNGTRLGGHPPTALTKFTPFTTGSLGHGPSIAAGLALAKKIKTDSGKVFCICGDGEWQEGSCWEALTFASNHKLNNLVFVIDCNNWQGYSKCSDVIGSNFETLVKRIEAFNSNTIICDGHNLEELSNTFTKLSFNTNSPAFIFIKTIKGYGIPLLEDTLDSHYKTLNDAMYAELKNMENK